MNWPADSSSWMDVIDHILVGIVLIACAAVPSWMSHKNSKGIKAIRDNVQNGHTVPMRADLDRALAAIEALAHDFKGLRQDLLTERDSRKAQVDDLRGDVDRMRRRP